VKNYVMAIDGAGHCSVGIYGMGVPRKLPAYPGLPTCPHARYEWGKSSPHCYNLACSILWDVYGDDLVVCCLALMFSTQIVTKLPLKGCRLTDEQVFDYCEGLAGLLADRVMSYDLSDPSEDTQ